MQDNPGIYLSTEVEAKFQFIKSRFQHGFSSVSGWGNVPEELRGATNPRACEPYFLPSC